MADLDIPSLLKRIAQGDRQAYAALVEHFQRPLFGFLGRMGLSQALAEDVAQETFLRAWRNLGSYDARKAGFSTWLFTIARNLAYDELRDSNRHHLDQINDDSARQLDDLACPEPAPDAALQQAQQKQQLQHAMQQLALPDRSALALAYLHDLDLVSIARIEDCTVSAIKTRIHRAKARLRELLTKHVAELGEAP